MVTSICRYRTRCERTVARAVATIRFVPSKMRSAYLGSGTANAGPIVKRLGDAPA
jgi:hypothetical protein